MKTVKVVFSLEAEKIYKFLNYKSQTSKTERMILNALNKKIEIIKINAHYGDPISKNLIPIEYKEKYGNINLFRIELPQFWRMLYTLTNNETQIEIIAFVIDILDHKRYNKKFSYK